MNATRSQLTDKYGFDRWGKDWFIRLPNGNVGLLNPNDPEAPPTDLRAIIDSLNQRGITAPLLLRITDFLKHRIQLIHNSFNSAIQELGYEGTYQGVFPVKVNQQAQVIDRIIEFGATYDFGLEVGSKAELLIALSQNLSQNAALICNGVKDSEFIRLALLSQRLGYNTFLVLENPNELEQILDLAESTGIRPQLGIRIKLTHRVSGKWADSSGDRSTFGLTIAQVVEVIDQLRNRDFLDCLILQHSHLGSQIPNILEIRLAAQEACRFYTELAKEGVPLRYLDLGGGLGIDYTGEHSANVNSINYGLEEYCHNTIETVKLEMDAAGVPHPCILTESGRACVAHSSMLVFNVLETTHYDSDIAVERDEEEHPLLENLRSVENFLSPRRVQECWNDVTFYRNEIRALFRRGQINLRTTAIAEKVSLHLIQKIIKLSEESDHEQEGESQEEFHRRTADILHCNFSLFQSLPDVWAIDQIHPIAPLQRLNEEPTRRAILSDITCDSDGIIENFALAEGISSILPVHKIEEGEEYYLGVFFIGAYQETLGDLHNLFGDTNVVTIELGNNGGYDLVHEQEGDTVSEVLEYVEYDPKRMLDAFKTRIEKAVTKGDLSPSDRREMIKDFKDSLQGYTYYEH